MTLEEWKAEEFRRIELFSDWWVEGISLSPDDYPEDMSHSEWDEQFTFFVEDEVMRYD